MLLPALFTCREGPVLHVDPLSHFSHICSEKKIKVLLSIYIYAKLICEKGTHTYYVISLFLSHNLAEGAVHRSANSSELKIIAPVDDQYSGDKISSLNILLYYSNHGK